ncbi:MAG: Rieske (2Fe-2S) protein [Coraliomargarita sp.]|nr:Rieske (2Fe-2S) protein [Coraliomargarita sp.]
MAFPKAVTGAWHMVALSRDLKHGSVRKISLCNTPIALFRSKQGPGALVDRCQHRNYPLSAGRMHEGALECPYHGWRFGVDGACEKCQA